MASRMRWKTNTGWRQDLKRFIRRHRFTQVDMAHVLSIHSVVLSGYLNGGRSTTWHGRRGIIALLEDWEDETSRKIAKSLGAE